MDEVENGGMAVDVPTLVFDGNCSFCRRWVGRWRRATGDRVAYRPYQEAAGDFPGVRKEEFGRAVYLFEPDGRVSRAGEAVLRSLYLAGKWRGLYWAYRRVPGAARGVEVMYGFVAKNRGRW